MTASASTSSSSRALVTGASSGIGMRPLIRATSAGNKQDERDVQWPAA